MRASGSVRQLGYCPSCWAASISAIAISRRGFIRGPKAWAGAQQVPVVRCLLQQVRCFLHLDGEMAHLLFSQRVCSRCVLPGGLLSSGIGLRSLARDLKRNWRERLRNFVLLDDGFVGPASARSFLLLPTTMRSSWAILTSWAMANRPIQTVSLMRSEDPRNHIGHDRRGIASGQEQIGQALLAHAFQLSGGAHPGGITMTPTLCTQSGVEGRLSASWVGVAWA